MKLSASCALSVASLFSSVVAQFPVDCKEGAHVIVARASNEDPGFGILKNVSDAIVAQIPQSDEIAVPYPATIFPPKTLYIDSEPQGVGNLTLLIKQYGEACPDGKMALLGYSQGAHVIGDTLIGSNYDKFEAFPVTLGIDQKYIDKIFAVVMMGDPANVAGQPFLLGNSTRSGSFPRNNTNNWATTGLVSKLQSYCDSDDLFCDSGKSIPVHTGYIPEYGPDAVKFVVDKFNALGQGSNSTGNATLGGAGSGSPTATGLGALGGGQTATSMMNSLSDQAMATSAGASTTAAAEDGAAATSADGTSSTVVPGAAVRLGPSMNICAGVFAVVLAFAIYL